MKFSRIMGIKHPIVLGVIYLISFSPIAFLQAVSFDELSCLEPTILWILDKNSTNSNSIIDLDYMKAHIMAASGGDPAMINRSSHLGLCGVLNDNPIYDKKKSSLGLLHCPTNLTVAVYTLRYIENRLKNNKVLLPSPYSMDEEFLRFAVPCIFATGQADLDFAVTDFLLDPRPIGSPGTEFAELFNKQLDILKAQEDIISNGGNDEEKLANKIKLIGQMVKQLDTKYEYGANSDVPNRKDCSSFIGSIYSRALNFTLPRTTSEMLKKFEKQAILRPIKAFNDINHLMTGDVLLIDGHVAIVLNSQGAIMENSKRSSGVTVHLMTTQEVQNQYSHYIRFDDICVIEGKLK